MYLKRLASTIKVKKLEEGVSLMIGLVSIGQLRWTIAATLSRLKILGPNLLRRSRW